MSADRSPEPAFVPVETARRGAAGSPAMSPRQRPSLTKGGTKAPQPPRITMRMVLRNLEFRALTIAQLSSLGGDQLARVALSVLVYNRTNSPIYASLAFALSFVPAAIASPALGGLADRLPRKGVMIVGDLARAPLVGLIAIPGISLPLALVLIAAAGLIESPFESARGALLPDVLRGEKYQVGYAVSQICVQAAQVGGYGLAGLLLISFSPSSLLLIDAATFLVSAGLIARNVRPRPAAAKEPTAHRKAWWRHAMADARLGARLVMRRRSLRWLVLLAWTTTIASISYEGLGAPLARATGSTSSMVGVLLAAQPVGMVLGSLVVTRIPQHRRAASVRLLALVCVLPLVLGLLQPALPALLIIGVVSGFGGAFNVLASAMFIAAVPADVRGRALAFVGTGILLGNGVGVLIAGAVATAIDPRTAFGIIGLIGVAMVGCAEVDGLRPS
jgi:MFS family permease